MKKKEIAEVIEDSTGRNVLFRFEGNTTFTDVGTVVRLAEDHKIKGVHVSTSKNGLRFIKTNPDNDPANNLDALAKKGKKQKK